MPVRLPEELSSLTGNFIEVMVCFIAVLHAPLPFGLDLLHVHVAHVVVALGIIVVGLAKLLSDTRTVLSAMNNVVTLIDILT